MSEPSEEQARLPAARAAGADLAPPAGLPAFGFEVTARDGIARAGLLTTPHGVIETPAFVAVGTQATVKGLDPDIVAATGTQVLFANTYHLYLRPGAEVIAGLGGLHRFMGWSRPLFTDSGGFQVFSLGASIEHGVGKISSIFPDEVRARATPQERRRGGPGAAMVEVDEHEVRFVSHVDGSRHVLTAEKSIAIQRALGTDVVLAFDECTSPLHDEAYTRASAERTHRWLERCIAAFEREGPRHGYPQALFGVVQGGAFEEPRRRSAAIVGGQPLQGIAIGGNLGRSHTDMHRVLEWTVPALPPALPRHLLGIGDVPSVLAAVERGIDTFDCVTPTRNARGATALVLLDDEGRLRPEGRINLRNAPNAGEERPIEVGCDCATCARFSRAYLRHLFKAHEALGAQLVSVHNLRFMTRVMSEVRAAIAEGRFAELRERWLRARIR